MCEPACLKYIDDFHFTCEDKESAKIVARRTYDVAVELFAALCRKFDLDPLKDGVIISHWEGYRRGIASSHQDPEHFWTGMGLPYTMDGFRKAVREKMDEGKK